MIEPTADEVAQTLWNRYLNTVKDADSIQVAMKAYADFKRSLEVFDIIPVFSGYAYRCQRCASIADREIKTIHGPILSCEACSRHIPDDILCKPIPPPRVGASIPDSSQAK